VRNAGVAEAAWDIAQCYRIDKLAQPGGVAKIATMSP
jgi:hypothetical protein